MRQVFAVLVAVGLAAGTVAAQQAGTAGAAGYKVPRTPDGRPDLQGVWSNNGITPMTRPTQWKDKGLYLTNAEVEDLKATLAKFVDQGGDAIFGNVVQLALNAKDTGKFNRTLKIAQPAGVAPNVSIFDTGFQASASVDTSRAKVTIAPTFVDRRFAPDPGHVGMFSLAGIGRDVQTGEAWA